MPFVIGPVLWYLLCFIIITMLHAMYQHSRNVLIFLVVTFLVVNIFNGVATLLSMIHTVDEELIFSATYQCWISIPEDILLLNSVWILNIVLEVSAMGLAVWVALKHFRGLQRHSTGGIIRDCFTVLMKNHVLYFARW